MKTVLENKFTYKGYPCVVLFLPGAYRCGYVGIPLNNKLAKKSIDELSFLDCHGGITYSEPYLHECEDADTWWIDFDCAHCFDGYDIETAKQYFGEEPDFQRIYAIMQDLWNEANKEYKSSSLAYVKEECKKLVDQIEKEGH